MGLVSADLRKHGIELKLELTDRLPPLLGSHIELQQVILNLVMNAIDAMRSVHPRVLFVKSKLNDLHGVQVSIEDTGIGIRLTDVDKILRATVYDQRTWHGDGSFHLPFDHRASRWSHLGVTGCL
jgi:signal transduction histidine kinase